MSGFSGSDPTSCARCGAIIKDLKRHQKWHDKLEGTHELDPEDRPPSYPAKRIY